MTVVLDSNIWVSFAINKDLEFIASLQKNGTTVASCKDLLNELVNVISRPKMPETFRK